jgi:hypothetical protein
MKVIKNKDHVLFKNELGEYHLSLEEFNNLGEDKAKELAGQYANIDIDFTRARDLGFCEYGIKDFCEKLSLDLKKTYKINDLLNMLTVDVFLSYTSECSKLFGKDNIMNKFGGVYNFLNQNRTRDALYFVLNNGFIPDKQLHILACDFAENVLPHYEDKYPNDFRPRTAIDIKRLWIEEEYKEVE